MNYEPNLKHWCVGSVVIHDADAKDAKMLMRVVGFTRDGYVKTKYINPVFKRTEYRNPMHVLLDPVRFNIPLPNTATNEQAR